MVWRELKDHVTDCYFFHTNVQVADFKPCQSNNIQHLITQDDLNDLVWNLNLSKGKSKVLESRLQHWKLFSPGTKISFYLQSSMRSSNFFSIDGKLCYCNDIRALFESIGINYDPDDRKLFVDGFKESIMDSSVHNGNILLSISVAYSTILKKTYNTLQFILNRICYKKSRWFVFSDLKIILLLRDLQLGYSKYSCFLYLWESRARSKHYEKEHWLMTLETEAGQHIVINIRFFGFCKQNYPTSFAY